MTKREERTERFSEGRGLNILLGSFCTEIKKTEDGFLLEICNNEGLSSVCAERVIDARVPSGNEMNLLLATEKGAYPKLSRVCPAFYPDQCVATLCFDGVYDVNEAKSLVVEKCEKALLESGSRIIVTSYKMSGAPISEAYSDGMGILHVDERAFGDIFSAYEKGECLK